MKSTPPSSRLISSKSAALLSAALLAGLTASPASAASGTWSSLSTGLWSNTANWSGGVVADGAGNTASFSTLDLTGNVTVHLDSSRTIGSLSIGDTTTPFFSYTIDNNGSVGNILTLDGGAPAITVLASNTATISAVISGTAGFTKANGTGTLILTGVNTYSGTTSITGGSSGFLQINADSALGSSVLSISAANGGFRYGAAFNDLRDIAFGANGGRIDTNGFNVTYSSVLSGSITVGSSFTKVGNGTLTIAGSNNISGGGGVNVSGGYIQIDSNARLGNGTGGLTINSGASGGLRYGAAFNDLRAVTLGGSGGAIDTNGFNVTVSSTINSTGNGTLTKVGTGTLTLTANNTYAGATSITAGTLLINGNQSAATGAVTVSSGATLGGIGTVGGTATVNNGGTLSPGAGGAGTLSFSNGLSLANGSTYSFEGGDLVAVGGALTLNNNWTLSLGTGLQNGGSITIFTFGSITASPALSPTFDISGLGFTPTGTLSLSQVGNTIVLNGVSAASVPEPSSYALLAFGFGLVVWVRRMRRGAFVR